MKYYAVEMPDGKTYGVKAEIIADDYAKYYQSKGEDYQERFDAMMSLFDSNDYDFADWAKNNMNWDDVKDSVVVLKNETPGYFDYQDGWANGDYTYLTEPTDA